MIKIKNPSLEFDWLPNSVRKGISTPRLVLLGGDWCGGAYWRQTDSRCVPSQFGLDMDLSEGAVIGLCASRNAGTLAHEYRHHWQIESGYKIGASVWHQANADSYQRSIIRYFRSYWWEMDALKFQLKHAPDDVSLLWKEWLIH
jgi:hypothetical protein